MAMMFKKLRARKEFKEMSKVFYAMANSGVSIYTLEKQVKRMDLVLATSPIFEGLRNEFNTEMEAIRVLPSTILKGFMNKEVM